MAETIIIYGAIGCKDTARMKKRLRQMGIPFRCETIEYNMAAERFVLFVNRGRCITPTVLIDNGKHKEVLVKPGDDELEKALLHTGYLVVK
ncbi:MAG TPA: hypothetical protein VFQ30_07965 [Ktedonobacteraceae bacterium]|nr:hypothetical protein [Ktedonobacteraceae bacterium]